MTTENYIIFDLEDIHNIRFECKACRASFSVLLATWEKSAIVCVNCREPFLKDGSVEQEAIENLKKAAKALFLTKTARSFKIRLELPVIKTDEILTRQS